LVLKHVRGKTNEKSKDVTTLDWNVSSITYSYLYQDTYICMIESKASILLNVTKIM
jgi:hypothetical protein